MELELCGNGFRWEETVLETVVNREETRECIVPDASPDIEAVLDTDACVLLKRREAERGRVVLEGTVRCSVLYRPESGPAPAVLETELPFQCTAEGEEITPGCGVFALPRVTLAETRTLNPRKVLLRIGLAAEVAVTREKQCTLAGGVASPEQWRVEQLVARREGSFLLAAAEKPFYCADDLTLPGSKPPIDEVLRFRCCPFAGDARVSGGKLIFKGGVRLLLCYRSEEGNVETASFELPVSQVLDVPETREQGTFRLDLLVTEWTLSEPSADGRTVRAELELLAEALLRETKPLTLLTDAYSTAYPCETRTERVTLERLLRQELLRGTGRAQAETAGTVRGVSDATLFVGETFAAREEGAIALTAQCTASVVLEEGEGVFASYTRRFPVTLRLPAPEGAVCHFTAMPDGVDAVETVGGVELRAAVAFQVTLLETESAGVLSSLTVAEDSPRAPEGQPSLVLRQVSAGESLWQIAKSYAAPRQEIVEANGLEGESVLSGQLLLIPRRR